MKNIILAFVFIFSFYTLIGNVSSYTIPEEALRIRIVPHSNEPEDIVIKNIIKEHIELKLYNLLKDTKGIEEAKIIITNNLNSIDLEVKNLLNLYNYDKSYNINYGLNYFPDKEFQGITYVEGYYESLAITLGEGKGDNWWCVLFPPICLLETTENVKYTSLVKEIIEKYL